MVRAVSILVGTVLLLAVGWAVGNRPASARYEAAETAFAEKLAELQAERALVEARGYLWEARARMLLAMAEIEKRNFGTASEQATTAHELIVRAAASPGLQLDLSTARDMADSVMGKIGAMDPDARDLANRVVQELGRLLDRVGSA